MFRFNIRDVLALMTIAAVACASGIAIWRADSAEEMVGVFWLFVFGVACYALGAWLRWPSKSN